MTAGVFVDHAKLRTPKDGFVVTTFITVGTVAESVFSARPFWVTPRTVPAGILVEGP